MGSLNSVTIMGRLGKDPEQKNGSVVLFSVATDEGYKDKQTGEWVKRTEWHNVVAFGRTGENCLRFLAKGSQVLIQGKLRTSSWEAEGRTHYRTQVVADNVQFVGSKSERQASASSAYDEPPYAEPDSAGGSSDDDDVPF